MIGSRVELEYFDQNEGMSALFPREGTITSEFVAPSSADRWYVVSLDDPAELQQQIAGQQRYVLRTYREFLIRPRCLDAGLSRVPVSVFVAARSESGGPSGNGPELLCWGMARVLAT